MRSDIPEFLVCINLFERRLGKSFFILFIIVVWPFKNQFISFPYFFKG